MKAPMLALRLSVHTDLWWIRLIMFGRGICMAFAFVPLQAATYANISATDTGRASALSTQRQVAAALGVGVLLTVLLSHGQSPALSQYRMRSARVEPAMRGVLVHRELPLFSDQHP